MGSVTELPRATDLGDGDSRAVPERPPTGTGGGRGTTESQSSPPSLALNRSPACGKGGDTESPP